MPIYFLLSKRVLLSVGREPTLQAYFERGALFYNALTQPINWRRVQPSLVFGFPPRIHSCTEKLPGMRSALRCHSCRSAMDLRSRYQSSGEPESKGIMPRNLASVI